MGNDNEHESYRSTVLRWTIRFIFIYFSFYTLTRERFTDHIGWHKDKVALKLEKLMEIYEMGTGLEKNMKHTSEITKQHLKTWPLILKEIKKYESETIKFIAGLKKFENILDEGRFTQEAERLAMDIISGERYKELRALAEAIVRKLKDVEGSIITTIVEGYEKDFELFDNVYSKLMDNELNVTTASLFHQGFDFVNLYRDPLTNFEISHMQEIHKYAKEMYDAEKSIMTTEEHWIYHHFKFFETIYNPSLFWLYWDSYFWNMRYYIVPELMVKYKYSLEAYIDHMLDMTNGMKTCITSIENGRWKLIRNIMKGSERMNDKTLKLNALTKKILRGNCGDNCTIKGTYNYPMKSSTSIYEKGQPLGAPQMKNLGLTFVILYKQKKQQ